MPTKNPANKRIKLALIGASGAVGREMIKDLEESAIADRIDLTLFASPRSAGTALTFRGHTHKVKAFDIDALEGFGYALASAGSAFVKQQGRAIAAKKVTLIDNSSALRMEVDVPLIVPEVNWESFHPHAPTFGHLIANPNCSTIPLVVALKPLRDAFGLARVQTATYQSVSGAGQTGIEELASQVTSHFRFEPSKTKKFAQPIAFNVLPAIDVIDEQGHCFEEEKVVRETRKILGLSELPVLATTARVPTFHCHCEAVSVELAVDVTLDEVFEALGTMTSLTIYRTHNPSEFPTNKNFEGRKDVAISRVRLPLGETKSRFVQFWLVVDNLKKGASTNAVQILEELV